MCHSTAFSIEISNTGLDIVGGSDAKIFLGCILDQLVEAQGQESVTVNKSELPPAEGDELLHILTDSGELSIGDRPGLISVFAVLVLLQYWHSVLVCHDCFLLFSTSNSRHQMVSIIVFQVVEEDWYRCVVSVDPE